MRRLKITGLGIAVFALGVWANNTSVFSDGGETHLLSHRGVHQIYVGETRTNDTCSAGQIAPLTHGYIANTIPSIRAAFDAGAEIVEIDVHLTVDGVFAVYHDWTLGCQTNGTGVTHKQNFEYLQSLDLGYGYTEDGVTFPLRGTGVGMMPSLTDVFDADLGGQYLVNFKSNRAEEGTALVDFLSNETYRDQVYGVYGGDRPTAAAIEGQIGLRGFGKASLKTCLKSYLAVGWSGVVPASCRDMVVAIPMDYAPYFWGWPHKFTDRMKSVGTDVILWGPYDGTGFSSGIDDVDTLARVPNGFDGYVWTNMAEVIGPLMP